MLRASRALGIPLLLLTACSGPEEPAGRPSLRLASLLPAGEGPEPIALEKRLRQAFPLAAGAVLRVPLDELTHPELSFELGLRRGPKEEPDGPLGMSLVVSFEPESSGGAPRELARFEAGLAAGERESRWRARRVSLDIPPASFPGALRFEVRSEAEARTDAEPGTEPGAEVLLANAYLVDPSARADWPPVLLVSIDTLGARHTSLYGFEQPTTPALERLGAEGVVFEKAFAHQSWTLTSHASIFTGLLPDTHRVSMGRAIADELPLLPDLLQREGWWTFGVVNNPYLNPKYGYQRGYDAYDFAHTENEGGKRMRGAAEAIRVAEELLDSEARPPGPWFLFLHLMDPHSDWLERPYDAPADLVEAFVPEELRGKSWQPGATGLLARVNGGQAKLGEEELASYRAYYQAGIAHTDRELGRFFDRLRERGLWQDTWVVLTSDHGEEFLEHGRTMHTQGFDEVLHVPLVMKFPGAQHAGTRIATQVQGVDLVPTAVELLDLAFEGPTEGASLLGVIEGAPHPHPRLFAKGENHSMRADDVYVLRTEAWKALWWPDEEHFELYDLARDPGEEVDRAAEEPAVAADLLAALRSHRSARDQGWRVRVTPWSEGALELELRCEAGFTRFSSEDQGSKPGRGRPFVALSEDGRRLSFAFDPHRRVPDAPLGFDFDLAPGARHLRLSAHLDGEPLDPQRVRLGEKARAVEALPVELEPGAPELLRGPGEPALVTLPGGPLVVLWETRAAEASVDVSPEEAQLLEALGYVDR